MPILLESSSGDIAIELGGGDILLETVLSAYGYAGLRLRYIGADVISLRVAGAIPGIVCLNASARNGPGQGLLTLAGPYLTWQAPGSSTPGTPIAVDADGVYLVSDGADASKYLIVQSIASYLPAGGQAEIELQDTYNELGTTGPGDVSAANALAGTTTITRYTLFNATSDVITAAKLWLDNTASGFSALSVSSDGINFWTPTSAGDAHVLSWATIAAAASVPLWIKRVIGASTASTPSVLDVLQWQWVG